jgi:ankyrin repeat protein
MAEPPSSFHKAADAGDLVRVQALLVAGADIDERPWSNQLLPTPLYVAAENGHTTMVRYLVERGANIEATCFGEEKPLHIAVEKNHIDVVRILTEHGANKEAADNGGWTVLIHASFHGKVLLAEYLLEQGCDVDRATDGSGMTSLHYAAKRSNFEVAKLLFRFGATLDLRNDDGHTPADLATAADHHDIANAIRAEEMWRRRRTAMFVAFKATVAKDTQQPLLARLRHEYPVILRLVVSLL